MNALDDAIRSVLDADATAYVPAPGLTEAATQRGRTIRRRRAAATTGGAVAMAATVAVTAVALGGGPSHTRVAASPEPSPSADRVSYWIPVRVLGTAPTQLIAAADAEELDAGRQTMNLGSGTLSDGTRFYFYVAYPAFRAPGRLYISQAWARKQGPADFGDSSELVGMVKHLRAMSGTYPARDGGLWLAVAGEADTVRLAYVPEPGAAEITVPSTDGLGALLLDGPPDWDQARVRGYGAAGRLLFDQPIGAPRAESTASPSASASPSGDPGPAASPEPIPTDS